LSAMQAAVHIVEGVSELTDSMAAEFVLCWTFDPSDVFGERVEFTAHGAVFVVNAGMTEARISEERHPADHRIRMELHQELEARLLAAQVLSHVPYSLSLSTVSRWHPDGRKDAYVFAEGATMIIAGGRADISVTDPSGKTIRDTKRERIDRRNFTGAEGCKPNGGPGVRPDCQKLFRRGE
jgi:hypothetical protein